jgi:hypothetical protein
MGLGWGCTGRLDILKPISRVSHSWRSEIASSFTLELSFSESSLTVTSIPELSILFFVTRGSFNRICRIYIRGVQNGIQW